MGPHGFKPPRLRAALLTTLAAFAMTAFAAPGVAGAAEETPIDLTISCVPTALETGSVTNCTATAKSSAGAPAGGIRWLAAVGFLDLSDPLCELKPVSAKASACSTAITGYVEGQVNVAAGYFAPGASQAEATAAEAVSIHGGSLSVGCSPQPSVSGDPIECVVRVPGTPDGTAPPTGDVAFSAISRFGSRAQQIEPQCTLKPAHGGASCSVTYTPVFAAGTVDGGMSAVLAEYEGDATHPSEDGTGFAEVAARHEVEMSASCEYTEPVLLTKFECGAVVRNVSPTGGAPTGRLTLANEGLSAGVLNNTRCNLQPVSGDPKASTCTITYQPTRLGKQELEATYDGNESFEPAFQDGLWLNVIEGRETLTDLSCQTVTTGEIGRCFVHVLDIDAGPSVSPRGVVSFQASPSNPLFEFVGSFSCELEPVVVFSSRCAIKFSPTKAGTWTVRAKYEGSAATHALSAGKTTVSAKDPVLAPPE